MTADTAAPALAATARNVMDRIRYIVLGTIDEDGVHPHFAGVLRPIPIPRPLLGVDPDEPPLTQPEPGQPAERGDLRLHRAPRPDQQAVYVVGTAREVRPAALAKHLPRAFRPERGARAFTAEELTGEADLRLWVLRVDRWEVHISGAHPTLGSGTDRGTPVDPTE